MNHPITKWIIVGVSGLWLSGCISHQETVYRDVEQTSVEFENDTAARIFYEAMSEAATAQARSESTTEVDIPIIFEHQRRVVSGPNAAFNESVRSSDTNQDGKITELEAKIYAERAQTR